MNDPRKGFGAAKRYKKLNQYLYEVVPIPSTDIAYVNLDFSNKEEKFYHSHSLINSEVSIEKLGSVADAIYSISLDWAKYAEIESNLKVCLSYSDLFVSILYATLNGKILPKEALKYCPQKGNRPVVLPWHFECNQVDMEDISVLDDLKKSCKISSELFNESRRCNLFGYPVDNFLRQRPLTHFIY